MNKRYTIICFFLISVKIFSQDSPFDKKSNNMTLDGNLEYVENNLIDAEALYRKAISIDSLNNIASYNLANSFYKGQLNQEAANQYKLAIKKANSRQELHKGHHNLGNVYMQNKDYQNAVNSFKNALLNNPNDDETRYNYVLAKELEYIEPKGEYGYEYTFKPIHFFDLDCNLNDIVKKVEIIENFNVKP